MREINRKMRENFGRKKEVNRGIRIVIKLGI